MQVCDPKHMNLTLANYNIDLDKFSFTFDDLTVKCQGEHFKCVGYFFEFSMSRFGEYTQGDLDYMHLVFDPITIDLTMPDYYFFYEDKFEYNHNGVILRCVG